MHAGKTEATLTFVLSIDNRTGRGKPYFERSFEEKCTVKNKMLEPLKQENVANVLARWKCLLLTIDPTCCEMSLADLRELMSCKLLEAKEEFSDPRKGLGFALMLGDVSDRALCAKVPDCGHICYHFFGVTRSDTRAPWEMTVDGVKAEVLIDLEWASPAMEDMEHDQDHLAHHAAGGHH